MFLLELVRALETAGARFALAGGHAVSLHGAVRGTLDIDFVLAWTRADFEAASAAMGSLGLTSRLPVSAAQIFDFREEWLKERSLVAWSFQHPSDPGKVVDFSMTHDLRRLKVKTLPIGGVKVPLLAKADLIAMKRASGRPQDLADIQALDSLP